MCLVAQLVDVTGCKGTKYDGVTLVRPRDPTCSGRALQDYDLAHAGAPGGDRKTFPCKEQTISFLLQKLKMIRILLLHLIYFHFKCQWVS